MTNVDLPEKRTEPRSVFTSGLSLQVRASGQGFQPSQLRDMSKSGVRLETRNSIPPGTSLEFTFGMDRFVTEVRHCCPTSSGFIVGAEIRDIDSAARQSPLTAQSRY